jgi:hypothetical protein
VASCTNRPTRWVVLVQWICDRFRKPPVLDWHPVNSRKLPMIGNTRVTDNMGWEVREFRPMKEAAATAYATKKTKRLGGQ